MFSNEIYPMDVPVFANLDRITSAQYGHKVSSRKPARSNG